ncbi:MAG: hypothetical protein QOG23_2720 [Blastocatellia bacterium]|nr:hypothetical protein [Blastocatellia bacterium]
MKLLQLFFFLLVACCACSTSRSTSQSLGPSQAPQTTPVQQPNESTDSTDPTCCDPYANEELKKAWQTFTKDGRYRLARKSSDSRAYAFTWGDLGYDYESNHHHLAAIVEDVSRTDNARFGVVIFSAPSGENGAYNTYWLLRERDLSQASFFTASGYLELHMIGNNGSPEICDIRWNPRSKEYFCRKK